MQESSTDLRGFGLLPLAMKERHLLKADVSLSFRRPSAKGFSCGENACRTQKRKALKPDGFKAFCGGEGGIRTLETGFCQSAPLAGVCLQPLGHFSAHRSLRSGKRIL